MGSALNAELEAISEIGRPQNSGCCRNVGNPEGWESPAPRIVSIRSAERIQWITSSSALDLIGEVELAERSILRSASGIAACISVH